MEELTMIDVSESEYGTMVELVRGNRINLSDDRSVFAATYKDSWYCEFTNSEQVVTKLRLSKEAMTALVSLVTEPSSADILLKLLKEELTCKNSQPL
jgi:hypothetical protein